MNKYLIASMLFFGLYSSACRPSAQTSFAKSDEAYETMNAYPYNDNQAYLDAHGYYLTKERYEDLGYSIDLGKYAIFNISIFEDESSHSAVGAKLLVSPQLTSNDSCSPVATKTPAPTSEKMNGERTFTSTKLTDNENSSSKKNSKNVAPTAEENASKDEDTKEDSAVEVSSSEGSVIENTGSAVLKSTCSNSSTPVRSNPKIPQMWLVNEFSNVDSLIVDLSRIRPGDLILKASMDDDSVIEHSLTELPTRQRGGVIDIILKLKKAVQPEVKTMPVMTSK